MKKNIKRIISLAAALMLVLSGLVISGSAETGKWICAWGTGITEIGVGGYDNIGVRVANVTCRSVITPTASGSKLRLRFSNIYGQEALEIQHITVAKPFYDYENEEYGSKILASTCVDVTFEGKKSVSIPAGEELVSDEIDYKVTALEPVSVSMYISKLCEIRCAGFSGGYSYLTTGLGDLSDNAVFGLGSIKMSYGLVSVVPAISSMDVLSDDSSAYSAVIIGDSTITNDFPLYLAKTLNKMGYDNIGIAGKGIIGNSLLADGVGVGSCIFGISLLKRFDVDALSQSGVKYVFVKIGCNDIVHPKSGDNAEKYGSVQPTAAQLEDGLTELANRCHEKGIKIVMAYLGPWNGYTRDFFGTGAKYNFSLEDWAIACDVNNWIKTTDVFDGVVDLNTCCTSTEDETTILAKYTKDGAHPNDDLQQLWADIFPVQLLGATPKMTKITLNEALIKLVPDGTYDLDETIYPDDVKNKSVTWSSSDNNVATVDKNGVVTAVGEGIAKITCKSKNSGIKAGCVVCVCGIALSKATVTLSRNESVSLVASCTPSALKVDSLSWMSSDKSVAVVDANGKVTAKGAGKCKIICVRNDVGIEAVCSVNVSKDVAVTKVTLDKTSKTMKKGDRFSLGVTVSPKNATNDTVKFSTSDKSVATVTQSGLVTAVGKGSCTITCKSVDTGVKTECKIKVTGVAVKSVRLNRSTASINKGSTITLRAIVNPLNADNSSVKWSSSNKKIATVSSSGVVKGIKAGTCKITCKTVDGGKTAVCTVTVKSNKITAIKLSKTSMSLNVDETGKLKATVTPSSASKSGLKWTSSNKRVATVSSSGVVTAKAPGKTVIYCKSPDGTVATKCIVTVNGYPVFGVKLNKTSATMNKGDSLQLKATVLPEDAGNKNVIWSSSDTRVAAVTSSGKVKAVGSGKAIITVKTQEGSVKTTCTITVK